MTYKFPTTSINTIYLMMGFNCNFRCRHCIQTTTDISKPCVASNSQISQATLDYIRHLINIRPTEFGKIKLMFWGGEPLLYFNIIEQIVGLFGSRIDYALVTNGSLLTEKYVQYFNEHNVHVALSYDGKQTEKVRGINVLENEHILELVKQLKNKSICTVISAYNYDFVELFKDIEKKLGDVPLSFEHMRVTWQMPKDLYEVDLAAYDKALQKIADKALCDIWQSEMSREVSVFLPYLKMLCSKERTPLNCGQMYRVMNIDLQGNVYSCHNSCKPVGTVNDERFVLLQRQDSFVNTNRPKQCEHCEVFALCNGGCPNEITNNEGERYTCAMNKIFFSKVFWLVKSLEEQFVEVDLRE